MSVHQFALVIFEIILGVNIITLARDLAQAAGQWAWLSALAGGALSFAAAYMLLRLGNLFPGVELYEYMPRIWGKTVGRLLNWFWVCMFAIKLSLILRVFANVISFTMFDMTPQPVIIASMLAVCTYGAVQSWGVILRITQITVIGITPFMLTVWFSCMLNFELDRILPLQPESWGAVARGALVSLDAYSGYELLPLLLPMVRQGKVKAETALAVTFAALTAVYVASMLMTIGVLAAETTQYLQFPAITTVKTVRLPGLFLERLETYLVFFWIPTVFGTVLLVLYGAGKLAGRTLSHQNHQAFVLFLIPLIFVGTTLLDDPDVFRTFNAMSNRLGQAYSFLIVPLTLLLASLQRRWSADEKSSTRT